MRGAWDKLGGVMNHLVPATARAAVCALLLAALTVQAAPPPLPVLTGLDAKGHPKPMVTLNQYKQGMYCDLAVDATGTFHAVFTDLPAVGGVTYLYYRSSPDGVTWSAPKNLSDDESDQRAGYGQVAVDSGGSVYAVWKYVPNDTLLDGPGGYQAGVMAYRCLSGGAWSRIVKLNDPKLPAFSWFLGQGSHGELHVVWSQMAQVEPRFLQGPDYADAVVDAALHGESVTAARAVVTPKLHLTAEQQEAMHRAGHYPTAEQTTPTRTGFLNLRGFLDTHDLVHFIAESPDTGDRRRRIMTFDGAALHQIYAYEPDSAGLTFSNPPALLADAANQQHVIRTPERSEVACIRDYPLNGGTVGDPVDAIAMPDGKGRILHWQAMQIAGGRMCVTASLLPGDAVGWQVDLWATFSDGGGKWTTPVCVTNNKRRATTQDTTLIGGNLVRSTTYLPQFASVITARDGHPCVLMVTDAYTVTGIVGTGRSGNISVSHPVVDFLKL
jgi:hypothetical protein